MRPLLIAPQSLDQVERVTREDWRRKWESMRAASPDLEIVTEQSVEEGEWIAHRYLVRGTHTGDFFGLPPTGAPSRPVARTWSGSATASWSNTGPSPCRCGPASGGEPGGHGAAVDQQRGRGGVGRLVAWCGAAAALARARRRSCCKVRRAIAAPMPSVGR